MRVSTSMVYGLSAERIAQQQSTLLRTQQQLGSGRRMLAPSDDPVASAQLLRETQARATNERHAANQDAAQASIALAESVLGDAGSAIADARTLLVGAGSGVLSDSDRRSLAIELRAHADRLLGVANTRDADGNYLFSGYRGDTQPFSATATGAQYLGDEGEREIEVASGRSLPVSVNGARIFERAPGGNGHFTVTPGVANAGSAIHDAGALADPAQATGHAYRVLFHVTAGVTTYDVLDLTAATTVVSGAAYASGQGIAFDGLQLTVSGAPADNDRFDLAPSASTSVFATLKSTIALLELPAPTATNRAALANGLASSIASLDQSMNRVLDVRAQLGAYLGEIDSLRELVSGRAVQHEAEISRLGDLDYAEALTRFASQQAALQAAQQSFLRVSSLSLFELL